MEEKQIILNNLLVRYYAWKNPEPRPFEKERGRADSSALLFLHGWRSESSVWFPVIPALLEKTSYDIYALDLPGFGKSQTPPTSFSLDDYREIITAFIKKLGLTEVMLVGHSFGGRIAVACAATYPDFFKKMVLVNSAGIHLKTGGLRFKKYIAKILKPLFRLPFLSRLRAPLYNAIGSEDYLATPELREVFVKVVNEDLRPLFPRIRAKTLIVWGDNDTVTPLEAGKIMRKEIPHAELTVLENAGHFSFLDQKEEFVRTITKFINE